MNANQIKYFVLQSIQFLVFIILFSFILETGFSRLTNEPFIDLLSNYLKSIFTLNKMGLWTVITLTYSYFRVKKANL